jgi:hypothetical protein
MKNIHIIPTDKPSRLLYFGTSKELTLQVNPATFRVFERSTQNIYITSDEEIKEGWILVNGFILRQVDYIDGYMVIDTTGGKHHNSVCEKIILTTDQDLIKDGVQGIPDEFLEWFVKNPSCEWVEVEKSNLLNTSRTYLGVDKYKIIIPQEKPKPKCVTGCKHFSCGEVKHHKDCFYYRLQEAAEKMYSEEEVENIITKLMHEVHTGDICYGNNVIDFKISPRKWFKQFKKK